jgi:hypothetical protein
MLIYGGDLFKSQTLGYSRSIGAASGLGTGEPKIPQKP